MFDWKAAIEEELGKHTLFELPENFETILNEIEAMQLTLPEVQLPMEEKIDELWEKFKDIPYLRGKIEKMKREFEEKAEELSADALRWSVRNLCN